MRQNKILRKKVKKTGYFRKTTLNKVVLILSPFFAIAMAYASFATDGKTFTADQPSDGAYSMNTIYNGNTPLSYYYNFSAIRSGTFAREDYANIASVEEEAAKETANILALSETCSGDSGLGGVQARKMEDEKQLAMTTINMDKIFKVGQQGGCFNALTSFPDLSVALPSLGTIFSSLTKTLQDYAVRKACKAVNSAIDSAISPIKEKLEKVSDSGQLDMSGRLNKELMKKYYEIDPELGRVSTQVGGNGDYEWSTQNLGDSNGK